MIWTYRVFRDQAGRYSIREVFYEQDGTLLNYGKQPAAPLDSSFEDLMQLVAWFREAFDAPVLSLEAVEQELAARPQPIHPEQPLSDRTGMISLHQVIAHLAASDDTEHVQETETERTPVTA